MSSDRPHLSRWLRGFCRSDARNGPCRLLVALASLATCPAGAQSWCAGNGFPPGPFAAPEMGCLALNRTDEYGNVWTDAAIDPESWSGAATGGYPGSLALCRVTQSEIGPDQLDLGTEHGALPRVYAMPPSGACPKTSPKYAASPDSHSPLSVSMIGVLSLAAIVLVGIVARWTCRSLFSN